MKQIIILVLGILGFVMCDTGFGMKDTPIPEEIIIVKAPIKQHPYQTEYEQMLYPTVRITAGFATGSGVIFETTHSLRSVQADEHRCTRCAPVGAPDHCCAKGTQIFILTASHVVEDETTVNIELYNLEVITGTVVITDTVKDLALIKPQINTDKIYTARLAPESYQAYLFTPIYTVGCSLGLKPRPSQGIISAINADSWEVSSPILPGNSGGPVFDGRTYEVIGIAVWVKLYNGQLVTTMAGIVPINQIYEFLEPLINTNTHE